MIFNRKMLMEIDNNGVEKRECNIFNKFTKEGGKLTNKHIYILICDEEVYIKKFNLPKAKGEKLYFLVKNELSFSIGSINNILFDFKIIKKTKTSIEVLVYYINDHKIAFIDPKIRNTNIKKISPIQFVIQNYYKSSIKLDKYIMMFTHLKCLYLIAIRQGYLVASMTIKDFTDAPQNINSIIETFRNKYSEEIMNIKDMYISKFFLEEGNHFQNNDFRIINLDDYNKEKILANFL